MENKHIKNIIGKIKSEHITPESKFRLNWKSYAFWLAWGFMVLVGALSFSLVVFNFMDISPELFHELGLGRLLGIIFLTAPYLWILLATFSLVFGLLAFRQTKRSYRYGNLFVASTSILAVSLIGASLHVARVNNMVRGHFGGDGPFGRYRDIAFPGERRWQNSRDGLLGGKIVEIQGGYFIMKGPRGDGLKVTYDGNTKMEEEGLLSINQHVGVIGKRLDGGGFYAKVIKKFPFGEMRPRGRFMNSAPVPFPLNL